MSTSINIARNNVERLEFMWDTIPVSFKRYCIKYELDYWKARLGYLRAIERSKRHAKNRAPPLTSAIDTVCASGYLDAAEIARKKLWQLQLVYGVDNARSECEDRS